MQSSDKRKRRSGWLAMSTRAVLPLIITCGGPAQAAEPAMSEVTFRRVTAGGELRGCALEFHAMFYDHVGKQGALVSVTGSVNLLFGPGKMPGGFFKIIGTDIERVSPPAVRRFKINFAALLMKGGPVPSNASLQCDVPEGRCLSLGWTGWMDWLMFVAEGQRMPIIFNRSANGLDSTVTLPVDMQVVMNTLACAQEVGEQLK